MTKPPFLSSMCIFLIYLQQKNTNRIPNSVETNVASARFTHTWRSIEIRNQDFGSYRRENITFGRNNLVNEHWNRTISWQGDNGARLLWFPITFSRSTRRAGHAKILLGGGFDGRSGSKRFVWLSRETHRCRSPESVHIDAPSQNVSET